MVVVVVVLWLVVLALGVFGFCSSCDMFDEMNEMV